MDGSQEAARTKLVVGLGNPGSKYVGTRHNVGFEVLETLARRLQADAPRAKFEGQMTQVNLAGSPVILFWPLTYMNESGRAVAAAVKFFKINPEVDLLVISDDLSLPLGKLRLRARGSAGGQKGLNDILRVLASQSIARLRVGIDPPPAGWDVADYVLSRSRKDEQDELRLALQNAADAVELWSRSGIETCMNKFNGAN